MKKKTPRLELPKIITGLKKLYKGLAKRLEEKTGKRVANVTVHALQLEKSALGEVCQALWKMIHLPLGSPSNLKKF